MVCVGFDCPCGDEGCCVSACNYCPCGDGKMRFVLVILVLVGTGEVTEAPAALPRGREDAKHQQTLGLLRLQQKHTF